MHKTTIYLTDEQKEGLQRAARIQERSEADLIREGVEWVNNRLSHPEPRLPLFDSGQPGLAERVDEILEEGFGEDW